MVRALSLLCFLGFFPVSYATESESEKLIRIENLIKDAVQNGKQAFTEISKSMQEMSKQGSLNSDIHSKILKILDQEIKSAAIETERVYKNTLQNMTLQEIDQIWQGHQFVQANIFQKILGSDNFHKLLSFKESITKEKMDRKTLARAKKYRKIMQIQKTEKMTLESSKKTMMANMKKLGQKLPRKQLKLMFRQMKEKQDWEGLVSAYYVVQELGQEKFEKLIKIVSSKPYQKLIELNLKIAQKQQRRNAELQSKLMKLVMSQIES